MTLILAAALGDCAVLCADRRIHVGYVSGEVKRATGDKLFLRWGCAIATSGIGHVDVPTAIRGMNDCAPATVEAVARLLADKFAPQEIVLFVAGLEAYGPALYRVDARTQSVAQLFSELGRAPAIFAAGALNGAAGDCAGVDSAHTLVARMLGVQRETARGNAAVGPPFQYVVLASGREPEIETVEA